MTERPRSHLGGGGDTGPRGAITASAIELFGSGQDRKPRGEGQPVGSARHTSVHVRARPPAEMLHLSRSAMATAAKRKWRRKQISPPEWERVFTSS